MKVVGVTKEKLFCWKRRVVKVVGLTKEKLFLLETESGEKLSLLETESSEGGWIDKRKAFFVGDEELDRLYCRVSICLDPWSIWPLSLSHLLPYHLLSVEGLQDLPNLNYGSHNQRLSVKAMR